MSEEKQWKFRLAEPADAEAFAVWVATNPQIDPKDIKAAEKKNNPTVVYFAVENPDGKVIAFAPCYAQMTLAHLGFNPEARASEKLQALQVLLDGAVGFAVQFGVREITTISKSEYGVAMWAQAHGFKMEERQLFTFDINPMLNLVKAAKEETPCAVPADK